MHIYNHSHSWRLGLCSMVTLLLLLYPTVNAQEPANASKTTVTEIVKETLDNQPFEQCLNKLQHQAKSEGVSEQVINSTLVGVEHDPRVIVYDQRQPEFSESFANYFNKRVNAWRIDKGRQMLAKYKPLLNTLVKKYGVPAHYLMAFWGLETNFGTYKGKMSVIRSLLTLACDPRRSEFFTAELMLALKIVQKEQLDPTQMLGSWAGAMGHTQFMPSSYTLYAIDGDGDAKVDLFNSIPDALTSAANFLHHLGWKAGFRWGREVKLAEDFAWHHSGMDNSKGLNQCRKMGVKQTNGKAIGVADIQAALLVPAGHTGPAFLVYDNFSVIMKWNRSEYYAIAVGHLADRISGSGQLYRPPAKTPNLNIEHIQLLQQKLNGLGFDVGKADGILGPATHKGIRDFQHNRKMIADGFPAGTVFSALGIELESGS